MAKNLQVNIPQEIRQFLWKIKKETGMPIERTVIQALHEYMKKHGQNLSK